MIKYYRSFYKVSWNTEMYYFITQKEPPKVRFLINFPRSINVI